MAKKVKPIDIFGIYDGPKVPYSFDDFCKELKFDANEREKKTNKTCKKS